MKFLRENGLWLVLVLSLSYLVFQISNSPGSEEQDAYYEQMMSVGKSAEALAWAREATDEDRRTIDEYENDRTLEIIEEIYQRGAAKVTAVEIDVDPGIGETTDILIVTLPEDPSQRAEVLKCRSLLPQWTGIGGTADRGQKYLMLWWD